MLLKLKVLQYIAIGVLTSFVQCGVRHQDTGQRSFGFWGVASLDRACCCTLFCMVDAADSLSLMSFTCSFRDMAWGIILLGEKLLHWCVFGPQQYLGLWHDTVFQTENRLYH